MLKMGLMVFFETAFVVFGLLCFAEAMFEKFKVWIWLQGYLDGFNGRSKFLFMLGQCEFCKRFWLTVLITILVLSFNGFFWSGLGLPFVVSGIYSFKKR